MLMQDAARVACVSRAFAHSWRCHPNLILSEESLGLNKNTCEEEGKRRNFTSTVDDIMKHHSGNGVKKLKVHVSSVHNKDSCHLDHLDSWLQHAVKPGIEELTITLPSMNGSYNFPCELLSGGTADSLRYLYLASCIFHHTFKIGCLGSLTRLQLYMVHIKDNELSCLLSNSLALEQLELRHCSTIKCLKIPCLQQFSYLGVTFCTKLQVIESKAPNLSSFRFGGGLHVQLALGETLQIKKLDIICNGAAFYALTELPSSMSNLEGLNIYSHSEMVNAPMVPGNFCNLRFLSIALGGVAYDYLSLASFFYASPCLETFSLNVIMPAHVELPSVFADPSGLRRMPQHRHKNLRRVQIYNFSSGKSLVELICHIVESTLSLECLTLDTTQGLPRCSVNKSGRCCMLRPGAVVEAQKALLAVQRYIKWKVPSTVEFIVLEPCCQCHA
ncbi:uncharacterized protein [Miscanthus floridulus]|uniref:uncharacterized protein n=1 Tax=Miscanthus floridulus TaxID=154761 RepID=UPI00345ABE8F